MKPATCFLLLLLTGLFVSSGVAQTVSKPAPPADIKGSAAYAELLLRKAEVQSDLEALSVDYTDEFPKVAEGRQAVALIDKEMARLLAAKPGDLPKLTLALGKLMTRKVELDVELWTLRKSLQDAHPDVKRARRKVEIFEAAIKEILG